MPKTYVLVKDRFEYFKPKIHVELEHAEKHETVTEVIIKGWRLEPSVMKVLELTMPHSLKIVSLKYLKIDKFINF